MYKNNSILVIWLVHNLKQAVEHQTHLLNSRTPELQNTITFPHINYHFLHS